MKNNRTKIALLVMTALLPAAASAKPKYGPEATPLAKAHEYFRGHAAPDFWVLSSYYVPQQNGGACSVASVVMALNAARSATHVPLTTEDKLVLQSTVVEKTGNSEWSRGVGPMGHGVTLDQLGGILKDAFKAYGFKDVQVEVNHADASTKQAKEKLHRDLLENEDSPRDLIIANFNQGVFTGDEPAGHISPVGAYDAKAGKVLIMDVDREWFEPYWVSEETFLKGMATQDKESGKTRGYVHIRF